MTTVDFKDRLQEAARAFKAGRQDAFDVLYGLAADCVFRIAVNVTGDQHAAEDIMQDVFLSVYRGIGGFREEASFFTWLYRITVNKSLSALRRRREQLTGDGTLPEVAVEPDPAAELRQEDLRLLRACIAGLPDDFRAVVVMRDVEGLSYEAIAEVEDLPVGTVRSRLNRGRTLVGEQFAARRKA
ncbi:MAG: sigma-70 family RNA polymerase sigma factor [Planctomycetota bacterium]